jgi:hypothetical protein
MDRNQLDKLIGFAVVAIVATNILNRIAPYLFYVVIGLVLIRVFQEHNRNKR